MADYPGKTLTPAEIYNQVNPQLAKDVEEYKEAVMQWWDKASEQDRKIFVNMALNNQHGSEEKFNTLMETVGEKNTQPYLDYYKSLEHRPS